MKRSGAPLDESCRMKRCGTPFNEPPEKNARTEDLSGANSPCSSKEMKDALMEEIQAHPCIWDTTSSLFQEKEMTAKAWNEIATKLEVNEFRLRSIWNTAWNRGHSMFTGTSADRHFQHIKSIKKKNTGITWSEYHSFSYNGHLVDLPASYTGFKILREAPTHIIGCAIDTAVEDNVFIKQISLAEENLVKREKHHAELAISLPHANILPPLKTYEINGNLYKVTEMLDSRLSDIINDRTTHFLVSKILYQLVEVIRVLHSNGLAHGDISMNSVFVYPDGEIRMESYGMVDENKSLEEQQKYDILTIGMIAAHLLMEEECAASYGKKLQEGNFDWQHILEGGEGSELTDANAQDLVTKLISNNAALDDIKGHKYFQTFNQRISLEDNKETNREQPRSSIISCLSS